VIHVGWNGRLSAAMGRCTAELFSEYTIEFSPKLYALATEEKILNNMRHEIAHAYAHRLTGRMGHDNAWRHMMVVFGELPQTKYTICEKNFGDNASEVMRAALKRRRKRVRVHCSCGSKTLTCGPVQAKRLKAGTARYRCSACRQIIPTTVKLEEI